MANKSGILTYQSEDPEFSSAINSINQQAESMADSGQTLMDKYFPVTPAEDPSTEESSPEEQQSSPWLKFLDKKRSRARSRLQSARRSAASQKLPNNPIDLDIPGIPRKAAGLPDYAFPFDAPAKFLPQKTGVGDYLSANEKYLDSSRRKRVAVSGEVDRGSSVKVKSGTLGDENLKNKYGVSASSGRAG